MTDDPSDTDPTDPTDPTPDPVVAPVFEPVLTVIKQGGFAIVHQERVQGQPQDIYLDPDEAESVAWALLSYDPATADSASDVADPANTDLTQLNDGGSFS